MQINNNTNNKMHLIAVYWWWFDTSFGWWYENVLTLKQINWVTAAMEVKATKLYITHKLYM